MVKFKTGNLIVKIEWRWAQLYGVDGNPSCKNSSEGAPPTPAPLPDFSRLELFWPIVLHSPFTSPQSGLKCRKGSFHYHVELEAALLLHLRWKNKPVYS